MAVTRNVNTAGVTPTGNRRIVPNRPVWINRATFALPWDHSYNGKPLHR